MVGKIYVVRHIEDNSDISKEKVEETLKDVFKGISSRKAEEVYEMLWTAVSDADIMSLEVLVRVAVRNVLNVIEKEKIEPCLFTGYKNDSGHIFVFIENGEIKYIMTVSDIVIDYMRYTLKFDRDKVVLNWEDPFYEVIHLYEKEVK